MKTILNSRYQLIKSIGEGTFADVFLAIDLCPSGICRCLSDEALRHLETLERFSPDFEFVERHVTDQDQ